ncbi:MAG: phage tail assembly protein [Lachnospiraceae bacterium]
MSKEVLSEEKMNELLGEETDTKKRSEKDLLDEKKKDNRPVDEVPAGVHPLTKPIRVDGQEVTEISYDLDCLKPIQYINLVKRVAKMKKDTIPIPEVDMDVQISYFALASGIPVSVLKSNLSTTDYTQVCGLVRTFLLGASTEELEE